MKNSILDGNAAAAHISYAFTEIAVIYPITPSSPMAELADEWQASEKTNVFGNVPKIVEMQSESGVAGALHGALTCGALATTYTCSQGLLLMLPNMYKIAGELLPTVIHVSSRALATHALSIFGDHQDVMACRQTGFAMLSSASVQEAMDLSLIAHLAALEGEIPFLHFFDGFRTSHELASVQTIEYDEIRSLLPIDKIEKFRKRALSPENPVQRGTAQNSDIYFQNREAANSYYLALPDVVQTIMDKVGNLTKRAYHVFDYYGDPQAEYVAVLMGSSCSTMEETIDALRSESREKWKIGVIKVRLYRPFDQRRFLESIPKTCRKIAVLDRTKEAGALGEPLYLDVCSAILNSDRAFIEVVGGRYGLGSKEFTPSMCLAIFQNLKNTPSKNHFTIGICDDVTHTSLDFSENPVLPDDCVSCLFFGLGSDGMVGANKSSVKILGAHTDLHVQAYFCYDSKKSGGLTVSHLRFGKRPIKSAYLIARADFVACHDPSYLTRYDMLSSCKEGGIFLLNAPARTQKELERLLPAALKREIARKSLHFYVIDGTKIANDVGLGGRTSTIMQAAFFLLNPHLLPYEQALRYLRADIENKFSQKGKRMVEKNIAALQATKNAVRKIDYPTDWKNAREGAHLPEPPNNEYFQRFALPILSQKGDRLPVSAFSPDGSVPTDTIRHERRGIPYLLPQWLGENCIQCNQCAFSCPHAAIRPVLIEKDTAMPESFQTRPAVGISETRFRMQVVAPHCMGCGVCANICPAKDKALVMTQSDKIVDVESKNWSFAAHLPPIYPTVFKRNTVKGSQFYPPLFEYSYACAGCGEAAYIKILTQLFGEKLLIANATGCSSIYGGSAPTCPYSVNKEGKGPAWANSLFEDNAEFGFGMRLAWEYRQQTSEQKTQEEKSVWIIGGDGWAYDIGYGGLDHVLASAENVNVLVLDSEVYSNTGGQTSKSTPLGAVARFSVCGKRTKKKNLALMAMTYGYVYVAQVAIGADKQQFLNALTEAENYHGPSLIIAYSPCIAHGISMQNSMEEERAAVACGHWTLFRYHPQRTEPDNNPFRLDSKTPTEDLRAFYERENRFAVLKTTDPAAAEALLSQAEEDAKARMRLYQKLAENK